MLRIASRFETEAIDVLPERSWINAKVARNRSASYRRRMTYKISYKNGPSPSAIAEGAKAAHELGLKLENDGHADVVIIDDDGTSLTVHQFGVRLNGVRFQ